MISELEVHTDVKDSSLRLPQQPLFLDLSEAMQGLKLAWLSPKLQAGGRAVQHEHIIIVPIPTCLCKRVSFLSSAKAL